MIRRLSLKGRSKRSASIAVPTSSRRKTSDDFEEEDDDGDDGDEGGGGNADTGGSDDDRTAGSLNRSKSERHYQSTGNMRAWTESDLQDLSADSWQRYYLRCFSVTPKGVVSRGDYVRYRRVGRSMSVVANRSTDRLTGDDSTTTMTTSTTMSTSAPSSTSVTTTTTTTTSTYLTVPGTQQHQLQDGSSTSTASSSLMSDLGIDDFTVYVVGSSGVGKTALTHQFTTSEHILNSKEKGDTDDRMVTISLDGDESRLIFKELKSAQLLTELKTISEPLPCAFLVVYSVTQMDSFLVATHILSQLHQEKTLEDKVVVLVGNKSELVRSRVVATEDGHSVASRYKVKYIETSVGINYNVDELVVGVLTNLRLALQRRTSHAATPRVSRWPKRLSRATTSIRRMFTRVLHGDKDHQQQQESSAG